MSLNRDAIGLKNIYIMVIIRLMYGGLFSKLFEFVFLLGIQGHHLAHVMELEISLLAC